MVLQRIGVCSSFEPYSFIFSTQKSSPCHFIVHEYHQIHVIFFSWSLWPTTPQYINTSTELFAKFTVINWAFPVCYVGQRRRHGSVNTTLRLKGHRVHLPLWVNIKISRGIRDADKPQKLVDWIYKWQHHISIMPPGVQQCVGTLMLTYIWCSKLNYEAPYEPHRVQASGVT